MNASIIWLAGVVLVAFAVQASLGFGAALFAVSFGSLVVAVDALLPAFLPVNLAMSVYIAARYHRHIAWPLLGRRVLPAVLVGVPIGLFAFHALPAPVLRRALGVFVVVLAGLELWRLWRAEVGADQRPLGRVTAFALLVLAGVAHGAFSTGGPIAVYVTGREIGHDKSAFRATLSALWLVLNTAIVVSYAAMGRITATSARATAVLVGPLVLGVVAGEAIHARLPLGPFKKVVFALVGAAGAVLLVDVDALRTLLR